MVERMKFPAFNAPIDSPLFTGFNADSSLFFGFCIASSKSNASVEQDVVHLHFALRSPTCV
ncbi:hypothetical protein M3Y99_00970100 [Aphelenchoides fujianensis]|nr:hypothetical protein M3Y99_00970100 [Aphelenchoides fujianensis]